MQLQESNWSCHACTFKNTAGAQCKVCGAKKQGSNDAVSRWICMHCGFDKNPGFVCQMCSTPKPTALKQTNTNTTDTSSPSLPPLPPPSTPSHTHDEPLMDNDDHHDAFWICPDCTFCNNESFNKDRCELCGGQRQRFTPTMGGSYEHNQYEMQLDQHAEQKHNNDYNQYNPHSYVYTQAPFNTVEYEDFAAALHLIVSSAPSSKSCITVLKALHKITSRISDESRKYRVLDVRSQHVQTKLLGFEGGFEYLQLLGFTLDATQTRLQCFQHPPQHILTRVVKLIDEYLQTQRAKIKRRKLQRQSSTLSKHSNGRVRNNGISVNGQNGSKYYSYDYRQQAVATQNNQHQNQPQTIVDQKEEDEEEDLKLDSGEFTLVQLVGLVTHESLRDDDAVRVLLLCHRCFSDSLELIDAIRKRFFVPAPEEAQQWTETEIIEWCQTIQRPIQNKCVEILCDWITNYFYPDFCQQPKVFADLQKFQQQVLECKYESDDGWYDSLAVFLASAIESSQHKLDNSNIQDLYGDGGEEQQNEQNQKVEVSEVEQLPQLNDFLRIGYDSEEIDKKKKSKRVRKEKKAIFEYSSQECAEQLTLTDFEYFSRIHTREYLDKVWKGNKHSTKNKVYPNLQKMIDRFNSIHKYVKTCILYCTSLASRVRIIAHFTDVCMRLLDLRNFFSLMAIFSALDSVYVSRLKYSCFRLENKHKSLLKNLSVVCDPNDNSTTLRKLTRRAAMSRQPSIPYIGVFLRDLTFVNEGAAKLVEGFVNFKRFERFGERCQIVESFRQIPYTQSLQKTVLAELIENDIDAFNHKLDGKLIKHLFNVAKLNDEKQATAEERKKLEGKKGGKNKKDKSKQNKNGKNKFFQFIKK